MPRFAAPIAEQIWDSKYRLKQADGTPIDLSVVGTKAGATRPEQARQNAAALRRLDDGLLQRISDLFDPPQLG